MQLIQSIDDFVAQLDTKEKYMFGLFVFACISTVLSVIIPGQYKRLLQSIFFMFDRKASIAHEISRKSFHLLGAISGILLRQLGQTRQRNFGLIVIFIAVFIFIFDNIRIRVQWINRLYCKYFQVLLREDEINKITGMSSFHMGVGVTMALFNRQSAEYGLCALFLGDSCAAIVGKALGGKIIRSRPPFTSKKSYEGLIACFLICLCLQWKISQKTTLVALTSALVELWCGEVIAINDNVLIPITSSLVVGSVAEVQKNIQIIIKILKRFLKNITS